MLPLAKAFILFAWLHPLTSTAATCIEANDEISLVQVQKNINKRGDPSSSKSDSHAESEAKGAGAKHAPKKLPAGAAKAQLEEETEESKQWPLGGPMLGGAYGFPAPGFPTPVHNWRAIAESTPAGLDSGEVLDSFDSNMAKSQNQVVAKAAQRLKFADETRNMRKHNLLEARKAIMHDRALMVEDFQKDKEKVLETGLKRRQIRKAAAERVARAKEDAEAHLYKMRQTKTAALMGRMAGQYQAEDQAQEAQDDMLEDWTSQNRQEEYQEQKMWRHKEEESEKDFIKGMVSEEKEYDEDWVHDSDEDKREMKAKMAADAAVEEDAIEGPEGLKNHVTKFQADRAIDDYTRMTFKEQAHIDQDATASEHTDAAAIAADVLP